MTTTLDAPPATRRRVTPTGVLVTSDPPESDAWFAARRGGITGTDMAKIAGESKYGNALSVWHDKRGDLEDEAGEAALWGTVFEDAIARVWAEREGVKVRRVGVIRHDEEHWRRASLDRLVVGCTAGGRCGLEVKLRSAYKSDQYREEVPDDVLAQVAWGRLTTGLDHMHVAVNVGGQELRTFLYEKDTPLEDLLLEEAAKVWQCVVTGTPPEVEPDGDGVLLGLLNQLYEHREGDRQVDPEKAQKYLEQYDRAHEAEVAAKTEKKQAQTGLVQLIDDGDAGLVENKVLFTYKRPRPSVKMSVPNVRLLEKNDPDLYARLLDGEYLVESQDGPRFDRKK